MNQSPKYAYFAVACDIDSEANSGFGIPVPGPDSRASCDMAMQRIKGSVSDVQTMAEWEDYVIVTSACEQPGMRISLADIMSQYMLRSRIPESCVVTLKASMFNTAGEVMALVKYVKNTPSIEKVVICVKYWHGLRCAEYVLRFLEWEGLTERVSVEVEPCKSKAAPAAIHREFWIATIKNMAVMAFYRLQYTLGKRL